MRVARLNLLRYGRFTDTSIEFPYADQDIHIIYGLNEAGKTTSMTAIEDMLFGIPTKSPYNFLHSYETLRIGAVLEHNDNSLEFQRRKGLKDTILGPDGNPLTGLEKSLKTFLNGSDKTFFNRMFSLSHTRLVEGGMAIIEAKDDLGHMLFAAGTGLSTLRDQMNRFSQEAEKIWAPRKSMDRLYYQAFDRLEKARAQQLEHTLDVRNWRAARKLLLDAESHLSACKKNFEKTSTKLKKLVRTRYIHSAIRQRGELIKEIENLGDVIRLPDDAIKQLESAEQQDAQLSATIDQVESQLEQAQTTLNAIKFDNELVKRADDITMLNEQRIEIRKEREDLPKRRRDLKHELKTISRLAQEIGWSSKEPLELIESIPARSDIDVVRKYVERHEALKVELRSARNVLKESKATLKDKTVCLSEIGEATDVSELSAVLKTVREISSVSGRIQDAKKLIENISDDIDRKIQFLSPTLPKDSDVESLVVPNRATVNTFRDDWKQWFKHREDTKERLSKIRNEQKLDQQELAHRMREEGMVSPDVVQNSRKFRDTLWRLINTRYIQQSEISADDKKTHAESLTDLPSSFERAVETADDVADRLFDKAQEVGELSVLSRNIVRRETEIEQLEDDRVRVEACWKELKKAWQNKWTNVPVKVLTPDEMLSWLDDRDSIVTLSDRKRDAVRQFEGHVEEERAGIELIYTTLTAMGKVVDKNDINSLSVIVEIADEYRIAEENKAEKIVELRKDVRSAQLEVSRRKDELDSIEAEWLVWQKDWEKAVSLIDLVSDKQPDIVSSRINIIDEMREHTNKARELRDARIATIERDIEEYEKNVAVAIEELAPDLSGDEVDASVATLVSRRDEASKLSQTETDLRKTVSKLTDSIKALNQDRKRVWLVVEPFFETACTKDVEELRKSIEKSDQMRSLKKRLDSVVRTLEDQGGGLAIEVLEAECEGVDIDELQTKEELTEAELTECNNQVGQALIAESEARRAFEAIGGDDIAARAAADYQEALASVEFATEQYIRTRTSASLLHWVVDRYRKEKQGPLVSRASELFRALTMNSFEKLEVRFDERDSLYLAGVRFDGEVVPVPGLSSGTEDQLFLALRIAGIKDYLVRAEPLPFVADDLFLNFDSDRAAAGFKVLGQLAERTQVLFYTHHQHLVDIAKETLGEEVHVEDLEPVL